MQRTFKTHGSFDQQQVFFKSLHGSEGISSLFDFEVKLVSSTPLNVTDMVGQEFTIEIEQGLLQPPRFLSGIALDFVSLGRDPATPKYYSYGLRLVPWLWRAQARKEYKIFQQKSVVDILQEVLDNYSHNVERRLRDSYRKWTYCVQYDETDFQFISRLMEQEGIFYWFEHAQGKHSMIIADFPGAHEDVSGGVEIPFYAQNTLSQPMQEYLDHWQAKSSVVPTTYSAIDYNLDTPKASMDVRRFGQSKKPHGLDLEIYDPIGGYTQESDGERYATVRMQAIEVSHKSVKGHGTARNIAPGRTFSLIRHPNQKQNQRYVITDSYYQFAESGYESSSDQESYLEISLKAIPYSTPYRAALVTPLPRTNGPQTARVVGPAGESIWTDKYGRIKVQFHWDRYGQENDQSSCWIRVSNPWASGGFGGVQIPRVNEEVVVDFIGGHPDRPIVVGRVYNMENMPPVDLPADATKSGFQTRTKDGTPDQHNEMTFEDAPGKELVNMVAQKDMSTRVKNDANSRVGGKSTTDITSNHDWTYRGHFTKKVIGNALYHHKKGHELEVTGDNTDTVVARQFREYTGPNTEKTLGQERLQVTGEPSMHDYNLGLVSKITGLREHQVSGVKSADYLTGLSTTVGATYKQTVGAGGTSLEADNLIFKSAGETAWKSANSVQLNGDTDIFLKSDASIRERTLCHVIESKSNIAITNKLDIKLVGFRSDSYMIGKSSTGFKLGLTGMSMAVQTWNVAATGLSVKLTAKSYSTVDFTGNLKGIKIQKKTETAESIFTIYI